MAAVTDALDCISRIDERVFSTDDRMNLVLGQKCHHALESVTIAHRNPMDMRIALNQVKYVKPQIDAPKVANHVDVPASAQRCY